MPAKRVVIGSEDTWVSTDLREWISGASNQEIRTTLESLDLPSGRNKGDFDQRARQIWSYVAQNTMYVEDPVAQRKGDFWQFPEETLALGRGDCEDCAFLLASLLIASGISTFCVRVVLGSVETGDQGPVQHAWVVYKNESGQWTLLESTADHAAKDWIDADGACAPGASPRYRPDLCLNPHHVWTVGIHRRIQNAASYLQSLPDRKSQLVL